MAILMYSISYLIAISILYATFDLFNKRSIPIWLIFATFFGALFISLNLEYGLISLIVCLFIGFIAWVISAKIGIADFIEIGIICLIMPNFIDIPLLIPLIALSIGIGAIFTYFSYKDGNNPLMISIGISAILLTLLTILV